MHRLQLAPGDDYNNSVSSSKERSISFYFQKYKLYDILDDCPSEIAVYYAHADMRELEQLLESHTLFSAFQPRPTFYCIYILSRLPMLTIDDDVCRHVWNGKIAIQITFDPVEAAGKETEPIYVCNAWHAPSSLLSGHQLICPL